MLCDWITKGTVTTVNMGFVVIVVFYKTYRLYEGRTNWFGENENQPKTLPKVQPSRVWVLKRFIRFLFFVLFFIFYFHIILFNFHEPSHFSVLIGTRLRSAEIARERLFFSEVGSSGNQVWSIILMRFPAQFRKMLVIRISFKTLLLLWPLSLNFLKCTKYWFLLRLVWCWTRKC